MQVQADLPHQQHRLECLPRRVGAMRAGTNECGMPSAKTGLIFGNDSRSKRMAIPIEYGSLPDERMKARQPLDRTDAPA